MQSRLQSKSRDVFLFDKSVFLVVLVQVKGQLHSNLTFHKCDVQQKQMQNADMGKIHYRSCSCSLTLEEGTLHPRHVESSAVNWRLTHILRGQGAIFRLTCFNDGTLGSKNHLVSFKLLTILTDQGHIGYMFKTSPSPGFFRRGPEVRFFKKLTN